MTHWPEGWSRESGAPPTDDATRAMPAVHDAPTRTAPAGDGWAAAPPTRPGGPGGPGGAGGPGGPGEPPTARPSSRQPAPPPFQRSRSGRRFGPKRVVAAVLVALLLVVAITGVLVAVALAKIDKVDAIRDYSGRPASSGGTNWLLVGSDSRGGLSAAERARLHTGTAAGQRTDTIILLHKPSSGQPTLVSLPRDSYVAIPGHGKNKLNAAFAFGGPALLVRTVEQATGLRVDHYAEIGFGGFVGVTDAVGGVTLCPTRDITDEKSGLNVKKGCQSMNGPTSLAYVRARYFDPKGDLGRVQRQQQYLSAVFHAALSPGVLLNPFRVVRLANAGTKALAVDKGDGTFDLIRLFLVMHSISGGHGKSVTVPVSDPAYRTPAGDAVKWDSEKARALFHSLT